MTDTVTVIQEWEINSTPKNVKAILDKGRISTYVAFILLDLCTTKKKQCAAKSTESQPL